MRVTMVTTTTPGVLKPRTFSFAESLRKAGHHVRLVVCSDVSLGITQEFDHRARQQLSGSGFEIEHVDVAAPPTSVVVREMLRRGVSSEVAAYSAPALTAGVRRAVDSHDADVVHVDRVRALQFVGLVERPVVLDLTDPRGFLGLQRPRSDMLRHRETIVDEVRQTLDILPARREEMRAAQRLHCLTASEASAQAMIAAGAPASHVTAVANATSKDRRSAPTPTRTSAGPRLAMTGNYRYAPNVLAIRDLADAMTYTRSGWIERTLLIGAHGSPSAMRSARRMGFGLVVDVDSVPAALVREGVDAAVAPHSIIRGFPNRVVDAVYLAGKPIILSGQTAAMLPSDVSEALPVYNQPEQFGATLDAVLSGAWASGERVEKAQAAIENACDESVVAAALERVYAQASSVH
jgi:hypothetical protein